MFCTPCNHLGGFQDLSAPHVILQSWLWDPGMHPSLAGSCCCWLYNRGTERKNAVTLGSQGNLAFLALEQSSGMQGDGLIDVISVESWMKDGVLDMVFSSISHYSDTYCSLSLYPMASIARQTQFLYMFCFVLYHLISVMYQ